MQREAQPFRAFLIRPMARAKTRDPGQRQHIVVETSNGPWPTSLLARAASASPSKKLQINARRNKRSALIGFRFQVSRRPIERSHDGRHLKTDMISLPSIAKPSMTDWRPLTVTSETSIRQDGSPLVPSKFALVRSTPVRVAPVRSALERSAPPNTAPFKFAPFSFAPLR